MISRYTGVVGELWATRSISAAARSSRAGRLADASAPGDRRLAPLAALTALLLWSTGCDECSQDGDCSDGIYCNGDEICRNGICAAGAAIVCDDDLGCTRDECDEELGGCRFVPEDRDGDGHYDIECDGDDCDDDSAESYPGAEELCDGMDNDCDGTVAEDRDQDGSFGPGPCAEQAGEEDCDDDDPGAFPGAREICDAVDNNCNGSIADEEDTDGDGAIDQTCGGDDCDDEVATVYPGAVEGCNAVDDDCDGQTDEDFECVRSFEYTCVTSCDSLGVFACSFSCELPVLPDSCDAGDERCNGLDDDCDGEIDETFSCARGSVAECTDAEGKSGLGICSEQCSPPSRAQCQAPY